MNDNVELLRFLLLYLASAERSPPEPIFIAAPDLAAQFNIFPHNIMEGLSFLLERGFIEGPGPYDPDHYIFRKLSKKGQLLVAALRDPKDWENAKALYLPYDKT
jgi:hypothetical protein